jgi:hypothetical protein
MLCSKPSDLAQLVLFEAPVPGERNRLKPEFSDAPGVFYMNVRRLILVGTEEDKIIRAVVVNGRHRPITRLQCLLLEYFPSAFLDFALPEDKARSLSAVGWNTLLGQTPHASELIPLLDPIVPILDGLNRLLICGGLEQIRRALHAMPAGKRT